MILVEPFVVFVTITGRFGRVLYVCMVYMFLNKKDGKKNKLPCSDATRKGFCPPPSWAAF